MLNFLKKLFGVYEAPKAEAPYKVEAAPEVKEPAKCGCGRSPSGYCVGLHALTAEAWAVHPDNPNKVEVVAEVAPVVEAKPAKKVRSAKPKTAEAKAAPKKAAKPKKPKTKQ